MPGFQESAQPKKTSSAVSTRERLIRSAERLFAEKGFRGATIAEICRGARANIAAVNYHFGDKERLYDIVWRRALTLARERYPLDGGLAPDAPPEKRLEAFIRAMLGRILDPGPVSILARIMTREFIEPSPALDGIAAEVVLPAADHLDGILRELVPDPGDENRLLLCRMSIIAQCILVNLTRESRDRLLKMRRLPTPSFETVVRHITEFSLAGLRSVGADGPEGNGR